MIKINNQYANKPERSFWRASIGGRHYADMADLWQPFRLSRSDRIATAGSCFAQHIGNNLALRGAAFMDMEPAPPVLTSTAEARKWGYGIFSCRYGNIYTTRQLVQLFDEAHGARKPVDPVWEKNGRFYDSLRPGVDPVGQDSAQTILTLRALHLAAVRKMFADLDLFVFTLGLTEGWELVDDNTMFPMAPGTVAGLYDPARYVFHNLNYQEVRDDLIGFWDRLKAVNSKARMLLTVSPVPLAATASNNHVLVATSYSKSVLRAVAGDLSESVEGISYFPSFEIINSHPSRGMFYDPDLRNVNMFGVNYVMKHFFSGELEKEFKDINKVNLDNEDLELICDEENLDKVK